MTWPLSTDKGPDQKQINQAAKATEDTLPIEETTKPDLESTKEEAQVAEITRTRTTNIATSVSSKETDGRSARKESSRTNLAEMPKDEHTGQETTSWMRIKISYQSTQLISQRTKYWMLRKNTDLT
jgi:hypothetical protein